MGPASARGRVVQNAVAPDFKVVGDGGKAPHELSMTQDRRGEGADLNLGRYHGCESEQIVLYPRDDCDPLKAKMMPAILAHKYKVRKQTWKTKGGLHWGTDNVWWRTDMRGYKHPEVAIGGYYIDEKTGHDAETDGWAHGKWIYDGHGHR